ncbi:M20 aminoacylase family protein [Variovorax paradoxus]|uniref:M20 aminoacylase family protein n=1 Tax=Variovorax paradoxus TaxID=34073 RepID=UPI0029C8511A|nr:M20 aminoacylase family protein [Variovorax paradoxus]
MTIGKLFDFEAMSSELRTLRQHIHQHPELAYEEHATAALVAERLRSWGYEVTTGVGTTGVVGTLRAGSGLRCIGLRADMDALPIHEETGLGYASSVPGTMHACGHDGHTAILLGAAKYLATTRQFSGTLNLYFQPAEEKGHDSGASRMIADALFERFPCDAVFGLHNHPGQPAGKFLFRSGPFMAASDKVVITIHGKGGHAARPHLAIDPAVVAASVVMALQTIVSRNIDPAQAAVVTVGVLQSGSANNVIAGSATLELSARSFSDAVQRQLRERIAAIAQGQAESYGATAQVSFLPGYPVLVNTPVETELAVSVARELFGDAQVDAHFDLVTASEDFAYMLQQRPGCFLRLGNGTLQEGFPVHHPKYDFNDRNLPVGAAYWSRLVERYLVD